MNWYAFIVFLGCIINSSFSFATPLQTMSQTFQTGWHSFKNNVTETWSLHPQNRDLYIPVITFHNRLMYDEEHIKKYNEEPWGGGFGISRWDEKDNWHGLYFVVIRDSFNRYEPMAGYEWQAVWRPFVSDKNFHIGAGYTAGVTSRHSWQYVPVPLVLPVASIGYGPISFHMTYVPGIYNNGNVYFAWLKFQF